MTVDCKSQPPCFANLEKVFREYVRRAGEGEHIAYIVQEKEFCGFDFFVDKCCSLL